MVNVEGSGKREENLKMFNLMNLQIHSYIMSAGYQACGFFRCWP